MPLQSLASKGSSTGGEFRAWGLAPCISSSPTVSLVYIVGSLAVNASPLCLGGLFANRLLAPPRCAEAAADAAAAGVKHPSPLVT